MGCGTMRGSSEWDEESGEGDGEGDGMPAW